MGLRIMGQDIEVIRRVLGGDIESFRVLVKRYEGPVARMIRNITGDSESCEDTAQEVFFAAFRKLADFDPARSAFSTWLFTIARHKSLNAMKKKRALSRSELREEADCSEPGDGLVREELFDELDRVLRTLPQRQMRAFVLAEFEELPYEQIAQIEGVGPGTIKSRIHRAKKKLRGALRHFGVDAV